VAGGGGIAPLDPTTLCTAMLGPATLAGGVAWLSSSIQCGRDALGDADVGELVSSLSRFIAAHPWSRAHAATLARWHRLVAIAGGSGLAPSVTGDIAATAALRSVGVVNSLRLADTLHRAATVARAPTAASACPWRTSSVTRDVASRRRAAASCPCTGEGSLALSCAAVHDVACADGARDTLPTLMAAPLQALSHIPDRAAVIATPAVPVAVLAYDAATDALLVALHAPHWDVPRCRTVVFSSGRRAVPGASARSLAKVAAADSHPLLSLLAEFEAIQHGSGATMTRIVAPTPTAAADVAPPLSTAEFDDAVDGDDGADGTAPASATGETPVGGAAFVEPDDTDTGAEVPSTAPARAKPNNKVGKAATSEGGGSGKVRSGLSRDDKLQWWEARHRLDARLGDVMAHCVALVQPLLAGMLGETTAVPPPPPAPATTATPAHDLPIPDATWGLNELRAACSARGITAIGKKATLLAAIAEWEAERSGGGATGAGADNAHSPLPLPSPLHLALCHTMQRLPWEAAFAAVWGRADASITRIPAPAWATLPSLLTSATTPSMASPSWSAWCRNLVGGRSTAADPTRLAVVVNPSADLPRTQMTLQPAVDELCTPASASPHHAGSVIVDPLYVGAPPPSGALADAVSRVDWLVYAGHGAGEAYLPRRDVAVKVRGAAGALLMGCSSAVLAPSSAWGGELDGPALSYLLAGAPAVVGNLWDVTDKDIDRFTTHLLSAAAPLWRDRAVHPPALASHMPSLVQRGRSTAKLPWLTGSAPVVWGFGGGCTDSDASAGASAPVALSVSSADVGKAAKASGKRAIVHAGGSGASSRSGRPSGV